MTLDLDAIEQRYAEVLRGDPAPLTGPRTMSFTPRDLRSDLQALISHIHELRWQLRKTRALMEEHGACDPGDGLEQGCSLLSDLENILTSTP